MVDWRFEPGGTEKETQVKGGWEWERRAAAGAEER